MVTWRCSLLASQQPDRWIVIQKPARHQSAHEQLEPSCHHSPPLIHRRVKHPPPLGVSAAASGLDGDVEVCQVEEAVRRFEQITGRRPRILIAKMGQDGHDRCVGACVSRGVDVETHFPCRTVLV
mgnify:CR=1 FL=1